MRTTRTAVIVAMLVVLVVGCGGKYKPRYTEVTGTVTLDGKPLRGVVVRFYPVVEGADSLPLSTGTTDETGRYALQSDSKHSGAVVGKSRVVINWPPRERGDDKGAARPTTPDVPLPIRYTSAIDSPLLVEVNETGPQTIDLKLEN